MQLIVAEIARTRPQILCLQEMQSILPGGPLKADHYSQLREELAVLGYDAAYVRKTNA
jgi:mRNA deadenylase 3'-5' endonuclease subunit Ccr4